MKKGDVVTGKVKSVGFPNKGIVEVCEATAGQQADSVAGNRQAGAEGGENRTHLVRVKGVLPGQTVRVRIKKMHHGSPEGMLLEVVEKSPVEVPCDCPHFEVCGGCSYRTLPYEEQLRLKEAQVTALLKPVIEGRNCSAAGSEVGDTVGSSESGATAVAEEGATSIRFEDIYEGICGSPILEGYRNKMEFSFGDEYKDGPLALGLHKRGSMYDIVPVTDCKIVDADYRAILKFTLEYFKEKGVPYFHKVQHTGYLRHLLVRKSKKYGEILVVLVTTSKLDEVCERNVHEEAGEGDAVCETANRPEGVSKHAEDQEALLAGFVEGLQALPLEGTLTGVVHTVNDSVADTVQDEGSEVLFGRAYIREELLGLQFKISQFSFFQTNSLGAEVLYGKVREFLLGDRGEEAQAGSAGTAFETGSDAAKTLERPRVIYDLYSGTGTIAQLLAPVADKVVGVEIVEEAVEAAKENAALNGLANCNFIAGDVLKVLDDLTAKPDMIILDPPRDGIHPKALPKIIGYGVDRIVYVSCKPTSLARDLEIFMANGYMPVRICTVDMFPDTVHVETVALLNNKNAKPMDYVEIGIDAEEYYRIKD